MRLFQYLAEKYVSLDLQESNAYRRELELEMQVGKVDKQSAPQACVHPDDSECEEVLDYSE